MSRFDAMGQRNMKLISMVAIAALSLTVATAANAADAVADFSASSNTGAWQYGEGVGGSSFTAFTNQVSGTLGAGFVGWQGANAQSLVPLIGLNTTGSTLVFSTVVDPNDVVFMHPGQGAGRDAIVQWTAPSAGVYHVTGLFELLDTNPSGVILSIYKNSTLYGPVPLTGPAASGTTPGGSAPFDGNLTFAQGDTLQFVVNNDGNFYNDSVGLSASISAAPEPAAWALMMVGVGGMGAALRTRRRKAVAA